MSAQDTFMIVLDKDLRIVNCNKLFADAVGVHDAENTKSPLKKYVAQRDRKNLEKWLYQCGIGDESSVLTFNFLANNRKYISVSASCLCGVYSDKEGYTISAQREEHSNFEARLVGDEFDFLRKLIDQSTEAMWCIEFHEPVDLLEDENEVVRQIFENWCSLRLCNKAMMNLYDIPIDADISKIPVSRNFPRSRANERYVRGLIEEKFHVDSAISIDIKHGGQAIYGDNSVRSDIVDDKLLRFWGTMHDVTDYRQLQAQMNREQRSLQGVLATIPEAVLNVGTDRRLKGANPAYETLIGQPIDFALDDKIENLFEFGIDFANLESLEFGSHTQCEIVSLHKNKERRRFIAWITPMSGIGTDSGLVITLRPVDYSGNGYTINREFDSIASKNGSQRDVG